MKNSHDPEPPVNDLAEEAIAAVLRAEREARQSIERAQIEAGQVAERARSSARNVAERTERRIRSVVIAFERELAGRLAEIDAEATAIARPHELTTDELAALDRAVHALARALTGAQP
jgi:hypothetical protein